MMDQVKYLVRKGHLGDVILTEPVARAVKRSGRRVVLVTEYDHVRPLLSVYDEVLPYSHYIDVLVKSKDIDFVVLAYELHPQYHYVDGFAICAGVDLKGDRHPIIRHGFSPIKKGTYCLIAPHTSQWARCMREWSFARYEELGRRIERELGLSTVFLEAGHSFEEMLGLIEHCSLFVGNDSGPGIVAQAFGRPALILFGGTESSKVLFSEDAEAVLVDVGCNGCRQWSRDSLVSCNTTICMDSISVDLVMERISMKTSSSSIRVRRT